jgi:ectoine hydroxylase-related dioxygenase (phytanoyl-CoA dioxygenase family)
MNRREKFIDEGYVVIDDFIPPHIIEEIKLELLELIKLLQLNESIEGFHDIDLSDSTNLDRAFLMLKDFNPELTSKIYSASKKLPSIAKFVSSEIHLALARELIGTKNVAFSERGWGLRIDYPKDTKHSTPLHQDYHTQLGSTDGIVIWVPLTDVEANMGPLIFYPTSDKLGTQKVKKIVNASLSTDLELDVSNSTLANFSMRQPEVKAGTAVVINYLLLHKSGMNLSNKCRWSILSRWFNFENSEAINRGWHGGIQEGFRFEDVYPELKIPEL